MNITANCADWHSCNARTFLELKKSMSITNDYFRLLACALAGFTIPLPRILSMYIWIENTNNFFFNNWPIAEWQAHLKDKPNLHPQDRNSFCYRSLSFEQCDYFRTNLATMNTISSDLARYLPDIKCGLGGILKHYYWSTTCFEFRWEVRMRQTYFVELSN